MQASLYERVGGEAAVMAALDIFYRKVMDDPFTKPFFAGLDMDAQVKMEATPQRNRGDNRVENLHLIRDRHE